MGSLIHSKQELGGSGERSANPFGTTKPSEEADDIVPGEVQAEQEHGDIRSVTCALSHLGDVPIGPIADFSGSTRI